MSTPLSHVIKARQSCRAPLRAAILPTLRAVRAPRPNTSRFSSSAPPARARRGYFIPLSLLALPPLLYYLYASSPSPTLSPFVYSDYTLTSTRRVSPQHAEITVALPSDSAALFDHPQIVASGPEHGAGAGAESEETITVHHVMLKNPDLMIERPYTPVNDVGADHAARLVVKRVRGGEVGRMVHALEPGVGVGLRGPLPTFTIDPAAYDRIVMISSGTGLAPFLQLLNKLPASSSSTSSSSPSSSSPPTPRLHLLHTLPAPDRQDWALDPAYLPAVAAKHGPNLVLERTPHNALDRAAIASATKREAGERIMVLVCLPPGTMRELCGGLTATLEQGQVTGLLRELGLSSSQVWKLE